MVKGFDVINQQKKQDMDIVCRAVFNPFAR